MHEFNLKMIKIILIIIVLAVTFGMVGSISMLKNSYYWRTRFFAAQRDYLKTEMAFAEYNYGGITNWIAALKSGRSNKTVNFKKTKSIPVLLYHGVISDPDWQLDDVNIRLADFQKQMFILKKSGWQTISLADYLAFMKGKKELPEKSFILTFDDGRKDSYYPVDSILKTLGYSAVMNVITGRSLGIDNEKSNFHLSMAELKVMAESGRWEMASHTRNGHNYEKVGPDNKQGHFLSDKLWFDSEKRLETDDEYYRRVREDISASKIDIEKKFGVSPLAFAYPFGDFGQESSNYPQSLNVLSGILSEIYPITFYQAGNTEFPNNYAGSSFMTKRIDMKSEAGVSPDKSAEKFLNLLNNNQDKPLNYIDDFSCDNGWIKGWGSLNINNGAMEISDSRNEDSGLAFLSGSRLWKDYFFRADVVLSKSNAFALTGRYANENNYVSCDFADNYIALTQRIKGQDRPDVEVLRLTNLNTVRKVQVGIMVNKNQAGCYLDGKLAVSGLIDSDLDHGGVSFKIWDSNPEQKGGVLRVKKVIISGIPAASPSR